MCSLILYFRKVNDKFNAGFFFKPRNLEKQLSIWLSLKISLMLTIHIFGIS